MAPDPPGRPLPPAVHTAWMSQPCRPSCMNGTSTSYAAVLMMPAGQVVQQRTTRRTGGPVRVRVPVAGDGVRVRVSVTGDERRFSAEPRALIGLVHGTNGNLRGTAEAEDHAGEDGEG